MVAACGVYGCSPRYLRLQAIDAIHGQIALPNAAEPLVVRSARAFNQHVLEAAALGLAAAALGAGCCSLVG